LFGAGVGLESPFLRSRARIERYNFIEGRAEDEAAFYKKLRRLEL